MQLLLILLQFLMSISFILLGSSSILLLLPLSLNSFSNLLILPLLKSFKGLKSLLHLSSNLLNFQIFFLNELSFISVVLLSIEFLVTQCLIESKIFKNALFFSQDSHLELFISNQSFYYYFLNLNNNFY